MEDEDYPTSPYSSSEQKRITRDIIEEIILDTND